jgi:hypothetical protein
MALKKSIKYKEILVADSYIKVYRIEGDKAKISFSVSYSASNASEVFNNEIYSCSYDIQGDNPIKQAYRHLKTLPDFADAVDC